jgi:hypothetical protein
VTRPFFFCYSDSAIFRFHQTFLRFHRALQWLNPFFLQCLDHFSYSNLAIFRFRRPFLRFHHALQWLNHFLLQCLIHFAIVTQLFFYFIRHSWDFISHFCYFIMRATMTQSFLWFYHALQWLNHFLLQRISYFFISLDILEILLAIFVISSCILLWLNHFCDFVRHSWDFTGHF